MGIPNVILPAENAAEAAVVQGVNVYGARYLAEVVAMIMRPEQFDGGGASRKCTSAGSLQPRPIFATCAARPWLSARWRWPRPDRTTSS